MSSRKLEIIGLVVAALIGIIIGIQSGGYSRAPHTTVPPPRPINTLPPPVETVLLTSPHESTIMLVHLDTTKHTASILSIPGSLWLPVATAGTTVENRISTATGTNLVATIEDDLGIPITQTISLSTLPGVVDVMGGVNVYFPNPVKDAYSGLNITTPGCHRLNGTQALALLRARHMSYLQNGSWQYDGTGDIGMITRDGQLLRILASAAASHPLVSSSSLFSLLASLPANITSNTLPVLNHYYPGYPGYIGPSGTNHGDVLLPYEPADQQAIDAFLGQSETPGSNVAPQSVRVAVLNGTGTKGQAAQTSSQLRSIGYSIVGSNSSFWLAHPFSRPETVVHYGHGEMAAAQSVMSHLSGVVTMSPGDGVAGSTVSIVTGNLSGASSTPAPATTPALMTVTPTGTGASHVYDLRVPGLSSHYSLIESTHKLPAYDQRACPGDQKS